MTEKSTPEVSFSIMIHFSVNREDYFLSFIQQTDVYTRAPITRPIVLMGPSGKKSQVRTEGRRDTISSIHLLIIKKTTKKTRRGD